MYLFVITFRDFLSYKFDFSIMKLPYVFWGKYIGLIILYYTLYLVLDVRKETIHTATPCEIVINDTNYQKISKD